LKTIEPQSNRINMMLFSRLLADKDSKD